MSREFPDYVDPWRAADGGRHVGGTIPLARFSRLLPLLASSEGEARFSLQFGYDAQRRPTVAVEVSAPLELVCQRSLEPYIEEVGQASVLQVIATPSEQALLSGDEEFVLVEEGRMAVAELVEDELLLAVPQVPRNPALEPVRLSTGEEDTSAVAEAGDPGKGRRQKPFAALADMMKNPNAK
ncbi:MAG: YceD family protein [Xanthomonadales bacterium]|nr:YceD family protein [Xanthomonadales bacterium]